MGAMLQWARAASELRVGGGGGCETRASELERAQACAPPAAGRCQQQSTRSHGRAGPARRASPAPPSRRPSGWRRPQVIAALALCLQLAALPAGQCQNATSAPDASAPAAPAGEPSEPALAGQNASQPAQSKLKPVNFTLVEQLFESTLNDDELVRRWRNMDAQFQEGIRSILKLVFPQIVAVSQDAKVSGDCSGGILKWILSLRNLRSWAIKMLDATGKPTSGIFEGSLTMFGNHRQCLGIRAPDEDEIEITDQFEEYFRGQFCVLHLRPWLGHKQRFYHLNSSVESLQRRTNKYYEKTLYDELADIAIAFNFIDIRMDLCVPSTCSVADIQRVADLLSRKLEMRAKVMRCDIESRDPTSTLLQHLDALTMIWLALPLALIALTILATLLVLFKVFQPTRAGPAAGRRNSAARLLRCLSVQGATQHLLTGSSWPSAPPQQQQQQQQLDNNSSGEGAIDKLAATSGHLSRPLPLYGLRNLFVVWFMIVQLTVELNYQYLRESLVLRNMLLAYWPFQIIINTSWIFESLILIGAFTFGYRNLESSAGQLARYVAQKYIRLVPSIVAVVALTIITPTLGLSSPVWKNFVERQAQVCRATGHLDLFFLQNFVAFEKVCLPHTWLLCAELQLIVLTIPLLLLLKKTFIRAEDSAIIGLQNGAELDKPAERAARAGACNFGANLKRLLCKSKAGLAGALLLLLGVALNFALVYSNQLPPAWFHTFPDAEQKSYYFGKYLTKAWTHLTTFIIGLYAGHLCRATIQLTGSGRRDSLTTAHHQDSAEGRAKDAARAPSCCGPWLLNLFALGGLLAIIFSTFAWSTSALPTPLVSALYDSLARLGWSLALVGLMVNLCLPDRQSRGYKGAARLFSHPASLFVGRLSFLAYLLSPYVHTLILALQEQSLFPSLYLIFHVILGNIVITYLLALVLAILIEQPIRLALNHLFKWRTADDACRQHSDGTGCNSPRSTLNNTTTTSVTSLAG